MARPSRFRVETRYGEPIRVLGRTLTPVVRVSSVAQQRGTVREDAVGGHGWIVVRARPIQVIETQNGRERIVAIPDVTGAALRQIALVAIVISLASIAIIAFARNKGKR